MKALICGSLAYDNIMVFHDSFKNHIIPDKIHSLNVCFVVPDMRKDYGGCGGNIAYGLKLLGADPVPMGTVGTDFDHYAQWLDQRDISCRHIKVIDDSYTAQCFITTDLDDNQITAFQVGAMGHSHENTIDAADDISIGIVAPDGKEGMLAHAAQFAAAGIPFIFDPGQNVPIMDKDELLRCIEQATWVTFNDYEWQLVIEKTGLTVAGITQLVDALIVTRGAEGSVIYTGGREIAIPVAKANRVKDPTGCGDAFRAGLLFGLMNNLDWEKTGRIASLMGAIKIEQLGTQKYSFTREEFKQRYRESFGLSADFLEIEKVPAA